MPKALWTAGAITTLGRGGSDLSATIIGAALEVSEVLVWKDVDGGSWHGWQKVAELLAVSLSPRVIFHHCYSGVLTGDPNIVVKAQPVSALTFDQAAELAYFGAKVLHPQAMKPARLQDNLAIRVKNSYNRYSLPFMLGV